MATKIEAPTDDSITTQTCGNLPEQKDMDVKEEIDHSVTDTDEHNQEQWNSPRVNAYRYFATLLAFTIMGMNDAAYGVSNTSLQE